MDTRPAVVSNGAGHFVVAGSLERLGKDLSTQRRLDVLHSTLYAQVVADSKHSRNAVELWYGEYVQTLKNLGWQMDMFDLQQQTPSGIFFKFSSMLEKCGDYRELLQSFQSVRVSNPKVQLLHKYTIDSNAINFQLLQFKREDKHGVTVSFAACYAQMTRSWMTRITSLNSTLTSYLFASMPTLLVKLFCGAQDGTLDYVKYSAHRERVLKELTDTQLTKLIVVL